jgi:type VI secretion system secreted protein VgrG
MRNAFQQIAIRAAVIVPFAAFLGNPFPGCASAILGSAQSFTVLGYAGVTNSGATQIYGNVGATPSASITGFPPGTVTGGTVLGPGSIADQALLDIDAAAVTLAGLGVTGSYATNLGGLTVTPGVYSLSGAASLLTGTLVLDAQNNSDAIFVFLLPISFTTASASVVSVINGGPGTAVYWVLGSGAELGSGSTFQGNILAYAGIALDSTASIGCGRAFSETASVTLIGNNISGNCSAQNFGGTQSDFGSLGFSGGSGTNGGGTGASPEPGTLTLLGMGLGAGCLLLRKPRCAR